VQPTEAIFFLDKIASDALAMIAAVELPGIKPKQDNKK
jgi:hypothetical protein